MFLSKLKHLNNNNNNVFFLFSSSELSAVAKQILESELEMCQQLLEMEPNSKCEYYFMLLSSVINHIIIIILIKEKL